MREVLVSGAVEDSTAKHLPECWCAERCPKYEGATCPCRDCICDELRACEQRVSKQWYERTLQGALGVVAGLYPFGYERLMRSLRQIEGP